MLPPQAAANNRGTAAGAAAGSCSDGIADSLPLEDAAGSVVGGLQARLAAVASGLDALFRFTRPHTMLGTAVSVCSVSALALGPAGLTSTAVRALAQALSSALLMNVCIVGINQVGAWVYVMPAVAEAAAASCSSSCCCFGGGLGTGAAGARPGLQSSARLTPGTALQTLAVFWFLGRCPGSCAAVSALDCALSFTVVCRPPLTASLPHLVLPLYCPPCTRTAPQLSDIDIDRVNKPYLPLAAGDFSVGVGLAIVLATGAASLAIGAAAGSPPLLATLGGSLALGIVYSADLPFLRWKRSPVLAAACILAVR